MTTTISGAGSAANTGGQEAAIMPTIVAAPKNEWRVNMASYSRFVRVWPVFGFWCFFCPGQDSRSGLIAEEDSLTVLRNRNGDVLASALERGGAHARDELSLGIEEFDEAFGLGRVHAPVGGDTHVHRVATTAETIRLQVLAPLAERRHFFSVTRVLANGVRTILGHEQVVSPSLDVHL